MKIRILVDVVLVVILAVASQSVAHDQANLERPRKPLFAAKIPKP